MSADGDLIGRCLRGKWTLESKLGEGGMATVYSALHHSGLQRAAIKILRPHLAAEPQVRERFQREGRAARALHHPGAVRILDDDETEDGLAYLVMELLEGQTWKAAWIERGKRLPVREVLMTSVAVLDVLQAAHDAAVIHRDIKPENVFLTSAGEVKLLDFGIARVVESASERTQTGAMLGTPAYMSPEQALAKWSQVDHRSDIFSLGASIRSLLTGVSLHGATTGSEALVMAATQQARPLAELCTNAPPALAAFVDRSVRFEKEERFASASEMRAAALHVLEEALPEVLELTESAEESASAKLPNTTGTGATVVSTPTADEPRGGRSAAAGTASSTSGRRALPRSREIGALVTGLALASVLVATFALRVPRLEPTLDRPLPADADLPTPRLDMKADVTAINVRSDAGPPSASTSNVLRGNAPRKSSRESAMLSANTLKASREKSARTGCRLKGPMALEILVTNDGRWVPRVLGPNRFDPDAGCVIVHMVGTSPPFEGSSFTMSSSIVP